MVGLLIVVAIAVAHWETRRGEARAGLENLKLLIEAGMADKTLWRWEEPVAVSVVGASSVAALELERVVHWYRSNLFKELDIQSQFEDNIDFSVTSNTAIYVIFDTDDNLAGRAYKDALQRAAPEHAASLTSTPNFDKGSSFPCHTARIDIGSAQNRPFALVYLSPRVALDVTELQACLFEEIGHALTFFGDSDADRLSPTVFNIGQRYGEIMIPTIADRLAIGFVYSPFSELGMSVEELEKTYWAYFRSIERFIDANTNL